VAERCRAFRPWTAVTSDWSKPSGIIRSGDQRVAVLRDAARAGNVNPNRFLIQDPLGNFGSGCRFRMSQLSSQFLNDNP
jgi:hypothetical protein